VSVLGLAIRHDSRTEQMVVLCAGEELFLIFISKLALGA
jgi:hypothetical protein